MVHRNVLLDGPQLSRATHGAAERVARWVPAFAGTTISISCYRRRITAVSSHEIARYITDENAASTVIAVITMFILKIWLPY